MGGEMKAGYKRTEVGVIPEGWSHAELQQVTEDDAPICYGIVQVGRFVMGGIPVLAIKNLNSDYGTNIHRASIEVEQLYTRSRIRPEDVLISVKGTTGRIGIVPKHFNGNISRDLARIRPRNGIISRFLYHMLQSELTQRRLSAATVGTTRMELSIAILKRVHILLPPLAEQKAIAEALSDVDALIGAMGRLIEKKRKIKQAAMQMLLSGQHRLPGFGGKWEVKRLGELFQFLNTANNPRADFSAFGNVGYIHYGDIHTNGSAFLDCAQANIPLIAQERVASAPFLEDGDLIMVDVSEDYAGIGKSVEVRNVGTRKIVAGLHTFLLRGNKTLLVDGFKGYLQFIHTLRSALVRLATGVSVYGISKNHVRSVEIPLPPLPEQKAISQILSDMDTEISALQTRLNKTKRLKSGMMQELLTGNTRLTTKEMV